MLELIHSVDGKIALKHNHITDAARYASDNWGLDDKAFKLAVNLRVPKGKSPQKLKAEIADKLSAWDKQSKVNVDFTYSVAEPMYRNPEGEWVKALLAVASENLGMAHTFGTSAGATSVHELPNGVQFGLARAEVKYTGHTDNEFKTVDQFLLDLQIVTEMMGRIGQLPKL